MHSIDKPKVSKIFHFHLWKVRFNISSPPLKSAGTPSGGYLGYTKKGRQHFGDLFLVSFIFSLFSEFLFEPLVECHVGTDFLLVLRLGKCQYVAR